MEPEPFIQIQVRQLYRQPTTVINTRGRIFDTELILPFKVLNYKVRREIYFYLTFNYLGDIHDLPDIIYVRIFVRDEDQIFYFDNHYLAKYYIFNSIFPEAITYTPPEELFDPPNRLHKDEFNYYNVYP